VAHVLAERGALYYDTPIVELWPEFGAHGKQRATVRHALSQSAGVPGLPRDLTVEDLCDWDKMCAIIREEVAAPLGVADELFFAIPKSEQGRLARLEDAPMPPEMAAAMQMPEDSPLLKLGPAETTTAAYGNRADVRSANIPAGCTVTARAVARMYAALLGEVDGVRLISPQRLQEVSAVAMSGVDQVFGFPTMWGLGYGIGQSLSNAHETQHIFGVGGVGGSHAYGDKANGIAFALTKNRLAPSFETAERIAAIATKAIAES
jgi:CubicO group peptidase (beta-lactamase class C family)